MVECQDCHDEKILALSHVDLAFVHLRYDHLQLALSYAEKIQQTFQLNEDKIFIARPTNALDDESRFAELATPVNVFELWQHAAKASGQWALVLTEKNQPTDEEQTLQEQSVLANKRVLVVDDNPINVDVARGFLLDMDADVLTASDGSQALAMLAEDTSIDLVCLDCQMPGMDGYQVSAAIRRGDCGASATSLPILAMTANAMAGTRERCLAAGMSDYLTKPFTPEALELHVSRLLSEREDQVNDVSIPGDAGIQSLWDTAAALTSLKHRSDRLLRLLDLFLANVPELLETLKAERNKYPLDLETLERLAHRLKGSAGNLRAPHLAELCTNLESFAHEGNQEQARALAFELETVLTQTAEEMQRFAASA